MALLIATLLLQAACSRAPSSWFANIRGEQASEASGPTPSDPPPALKVNSPSGSTLTPLFEVTGLKDGDQVILLRGADASCNPGTVVGQAVAKAGAISPSIQAINNSGSGAAAHFRARVERASGEILCTDSIAYSLPLASVNPGTTHPYYIPTLTDAVAIASGAVVNCAITRSGTVWCWGSHLFGGLGDGSPLASGSSIDINQTPVQVAGLTQVSQITSWGLWGMLALTQSGDLYCWGDCGPQGIQTRPILLDQLSGVIRLDKGLILRTNGEVSAIDDPNTSIVTGASGLRAYEGKALPITFHPDGSLQGPTFDQGSGNFAAQGNLNTTGPFLDAALGEKHACTLTGTQPQTSQVECYGDNTYGQLGNASGQPSINPIAVSVIGIKQLFGGTSATYAMNQNNEIYFWGRNTTETAPTPTLLPWLTNVKTIDAQTMGRACAVQSPGTVMCWRALSFSLSGP